MHTTLFCGCVLVLLWFGVDSRRIDQGWGDILHLNLTRSSKHYDYDADPLPPSTWPPSWHTWVAITVVDAARSGPPIFTKGERIAFDLVNQYTCRYDQQDILVPSTTREVDMCDYVAGYHWGLEAANDVNCTESGRINDTLAQLVWPQPFLSGAKFLGVDHVATQDCNHFYASGISIDGKTQQLDIWTTVEAGFPCLISLWDMATTLHTTWAFDGFSDFIPPEAAQCTAPKLICTESDWVCRSKPGLTQDQLGESLQWICNRIDCRTINPGGANYLPNTVEDHCNWAMNQYFQANKADQGIFACDFKGAGELVPLQRPQNKYRQGSFTEIFGTVVLNLDLVCPDV